MSSGADSIISRPSSAEPNIPDLPLDTSLFFNKIQNGNLKSELNTPKTLFNENEFEEKSNKHDSDSSHLFSPSEANLSVSKDISLQSRGFTPNKTITPMKRKKSLPNAMENSPLPHLSEDTIPNKDISSFIVSNDNQPTNIPHYSTLYPQYSPQNQIPEQLLRAFASGEIDASTPLPFPYSIYNMPQVTNFMTQQQQLMQHNNHNIGSLLHPTLPQMAFGIAPPQLAQFGNPVIQLPHYPPGMNSYPETFAQPLMMQVFPLPHHHYSPHSSTHPTIPTIHPSSVPYESPTLNNADYDTSTQNQPYSDSILAPSSNASVPIPNQPFSYNPHQTYSKLSSKQKMTLVRQLKYIVSRMDRHPPFKIIIKRRTPIQPCTQKSEQPIQPLYNQKPHTFLGPLYIPPETEINSSNHHLLNQMLKDRRLYCTDYFDSNIYTFAPPSANETNYNKKKKDIGNKNKDQQRLSKQQLRKRRVVTYSFFNILLAATMHKQPCGVYEVFLPFLNDIERYASDKFLYIKYTFASLMFDRSLDWELETALKIIVSNEKNQQPSSSLSHKDDDIILFCSREARSRLIHVINKLYHIYNDLPTTVDQLNQIILLKTKNSCKNKSSQHSCQHISQFILFLIEYLESMRDMIVIGVKPPLFENRVNMDQKPKLKAISKGIIKSIDEQGLSDYLISETKSLNLYEELVQLCTISRLNPAKLAKARIQNARLLLNKALDDENAIYRSRHLPYLPQPSPERWVNAQNEIHYSFKNVGEKRHSKGNNISQQQSSYPKVITTQKNKSILQNSTTVAADIVSTRRSSNHHKWNNNNNSNNNNNNNNNNNHNPIPSSFYAKKESYHDNKAYSASINLTQPHQRPNSKQLSQAQLALVQTVSCQNSNPREMLSQDVEEALSDLKQQQLELSRKFRELEEKEKQIIQSQSQMHLHDNNGHEPRIAVPCRQTPLPSLPTLAIKKETPRSQAWKENRVKSRFDTTTTNQNATVLQSLGHKSNTNRNPPHILPKGESIKRNKFNPRRKQSEEY